MDLETSVGSAAKSLIKTVVGFLRVQDYISFRLKRFINGAQHHLYDAFTEKGESSYWHDLRAGRLDEGHLVTFRGFQLNQWVPLQPGAWWHPDAPALRDRVSSSHEIPIQTGTEQVIALDPSAKLVMMSGGYGTFRLKTNTTPDGFSLFSLSSSGEMWKGIPILLTPEVVNGYERKRSQEGTKGIEIAEMSGELVPIPNKTNEHWPHSANG